MSSTRCWVQRFTGVYGETAPAVPRVWDKTSSRQLLVKHPLCEHRGVNKTVTIPQGREDYELLNRLEGRRS